MEIIRLFLCLDIRNELWNIQLRVGKEMKFMPYVAPEVVQRVKQIDLLTYLKNYEPYELVHFSGNVYTTRFHDSLKITNGKWMWWSQGIGGKSALDYLIKVSGYDFVQAVQMIAEQATIQPPISIPAEKKTEKKLILPKPYRYQTYASCWSSKRSRTSVRLGLRWYAIIRNLQ